MAVTASQDRDETPRTHLGRAGRPEPRVPQPRRPRCTAARPLYGLQHAGTDSNHPGERETARRNMTAGLIAGGFSALVFALCFIVALLYIAHG
jgi:hypothetical protein